MVRGDLQYNRQAKVELLSLKRYMKEIFLGFVLALLVSPQVVNAQASVTSTTTIQMIERPKTVAQISTEVYQTPFCWTVIGNANPALSMDHSTDLIGGVTLQLPPRAVCERLLAASTASSLVLLERESIGPFGMSLDAYYDHSWFVSPTPQELQERLLSSSVRVDIPTSTMAYADEYDQNTVLLDRVVPQYSSNGGPMFVFGEAFGKGTQSRYEPAFTNERFKGSYWESQEKRRMNGPKLWLYAHDWTVSATRKIKAMGWQRHVNGTFQEQDTFYYNINGKDLPSWKYADGLFVAPNEQRYAYRARATKEDQWYIVTNKGKVGPYRYVSYPLFTTENVLSYLVIEQKNGQDRYVWYREGKPQQSWDFIDSVYASDQGKQFSYRAMRRDAKGVERWYVVRNGKASDAWDYLSHLVVDPFTSRATYQARKEGKWFLVENTVSWPLVGEATGVYQDRLSQKSYAAGAIPSATPEVEDGRSWVQRNGSSWFVDRDFFTQAFSRTGQILMNRVAYTTTTMDSGPIATQYVLDQTLLPTLGLAGMRPYSDEELQTIQAQYPLFQYIFEDVHDRARARELFFDRENHLVLYQGDGKYLIKAVYQTHP